MNPLDWLLHEQVTIAGSPVLVREIVGNVFGLASAIFGMRRLVAAWPVGIVGNVLLFTVFLGGLFDTPQDKDLWGQVGRQVFFFAVSLYGWWRWYQNRKQTADAHGVQPRWASGRERIELLVLGVVLYAVFYPVLKALGSWGPQWDAWILTGSVLATYGMARGWVEFWLIWIGVDAVGVPLLLDAKFYPSATMYIVYGAFCVLGFATWLRLGRDADTPAPTEPRAETVA